jgi:hypothetical protein
MAATIRPERRPALAAVAAALVVLPLLILAVRIVRGRYLTFSDWANIELRTRDVGGAHTPLVGPFSRYGWNHPGPLLFYALTLPYRLLGSNGTGLLLGAVLVNAIAFALIGVVLWRRGGGTGLLLGGAVVLLLVRALGASFVINPWNPYVIVFPMLAVALLCWAAIDGDRWGLPVGVALGSFAVQSHVGAALGVAVPIAIAAVFLWRQWRTLLVSLGVLVLLWIPPLVEELQPHGGNLSSLVRFWTQSHSDVTGWSKGARILFPQLSIPAPWFTGHSDNTAFTFGVPTQWHFPFAILLLVGALVVAALRHDRQSWSLDAIALGLVVAGWVSAARVVGTPFDYVVQWLWIVGALSFLAIVWTAWRTLVASAAAVRVVAIASAVGALVLIAFIAAGAVRADFPQPVEERSIAAIAPAARAALRSLPDPVLVEPAPDLNSGNSAAGILALGARAGVDVRVPQSEAITVGAHRTIAPAQARSVVLVANDDAALPYSADPTRYHLLASTDPLTSRERVERNELAAQIHSAAKNGLRGVAQWLQAHPSQANRAAALDARGPRIDLFLDTEPTAAK